MSYQRAILPPTQRMNELLDALKQEFDTIANEASLYRMHKDEFDHKYNQQVAEMQQIRTMIYELELSHRKMKEHYEEEINRLKRELEARGGHVPPTASAPMLSQASMAGGQAPPPPSLGQSTSNVFGGIMSGQSGPSLAPPQQEGMHGQGPPPPPGLQPGMSQVPPQSMAPQQGQPPQPGYSSGYMNGYHQGPAPTPGGQLTPQSRALEQRSPHLTRASPGPPAGNNLADLDFDRVPNEYKKQASDWFVIYNDRAPRLLDVDLMHTLDHHSVVCCVRFSADGKYVATGCNRSAQIYDVQTGQRICILQDDTIDREGDLYIRSVCFSPDGRYLATGAEDKQIRVWDIKTKTIRHLFKGHEQDIYSLDFARNGRLIASGSGDRTVRVWDMDNGQCVLTLSIEDGVTTVVFSPDGRFVAAGSLDKSVRVWDAQTGFVVERLEAPDGHKDSVYSVAFAPNGKDLVSGSLDKTIKLWELQSARGMSSTAHKGGVCVKTFTGHKDFVLSVALTPDGQWVLSGSKDRGVQFWDPRTAQAQLMLQGHKNSVISVAPSPTGKLFATGSGDFRARIWSYTSLHDEKPLR
ncbi:WD40-repeat-containing domain protein [Dipodascopsis tothii]|uniref:WD40-repeat-containing domain protein n=1 Tax=Dipodascopsis tothii TaxID=44089 RepID=UPI0034CF47EC